MYLTEAAFGHDMYIHFDLRKDDEHVRANIKNGTELGKKAKSYMDQGLLVPDELTVDLVIDRLAPDENIVSRMSGRRACTGCGATYHIIQSVQEG